MHFVFFCTDKPGHAQVRAENRDAHIAYLKSFAAQVVMAGPTLADDGGGHGNEMTGSVLIMDFADRAAAEAFAEGDPYTKAGLFESVIIRPWKKVLPA